MRRLTYWLVLLFLTFPASATTYLIRPDGTGDFPTIQAAINAAAHGDSIMLANGVFTGAGNRDIQYQGKAITVQGNMGDPSSCVIDCSGSASNPHSGFVFVAGQPGAVLCGVTVRNGYADFGAAISCWQASPSIAACKCTNNTSPYDGGGFACVGPCSPSIVECDFSNNHARRGGGAYSTGSSPTFTNCRFFRNSAYDGGGLYSNWDTSCALVSCTLDQNGGTNLGGGIALDHSSVTSAGCLIAGNFAYLRGGGVHCYESQGTFERCTISENFVEGKGGGFYFYVGTYDVIGCTLVENLATDTGGGIRVHDQTTASIASTLIAFSLEGGAVRPEPYASVDFSCCNLYGNVGGDWVGPIAWNDGLNGNFSADPYFCDLASGDLHLWNYSPCNQAGLCGLIGAWPVGCTEPQEIPAPYATGRGEPILLGATPNPFTTSTTVGFSLPVAGSVTLEVLAPSGRLLQTFAGGRMDAGDHRLTWDRCNGVRLPAGPGVYFVRLAVDGREAGTLKAVVVR